MTPNQKNIMAKTANDIVLFLHDKGSASFYILRTLFYLRPHDRKEVLAMCQQIDPTIYSAEGAWWVV